MKLKTTKLKDDLESFRFTLGLPDNFHFENNVMMEEYLMLIISDYKSFGGGLKAHIGVSNAGI